MQVYVIKSKYGPIHNVHYLIGVVGEFFWCKALKVWLPTINLRAETVKTIGTLVGSNVQFK